MMGLIERKPFFIFISKPLYMFLLILIAYDFYVTKNLGKKYFLLKKTC